MAGIGIVGTGVSGLTLALRLQQLGVDVTLYAEATPDELRSSRLPNTVGRFPNTLARERALGVDHWRDPGYHMGSVRFRAVAPLDVAYEGRFAEPVQAVDFRVLLPRLLEDFAARGGRVVVERDPGPEAVDRLSAGHDAIVVAVGRRSMAGLFPVDAARSPYPEPQRLVFAGLFEGIAPPEGPHVSFNVAPGVGEVFQMAMGTADGVGTNLLVDAVPGGPLAPLVEVPPTDPGWSAMAVELLTEHAPAVAERVDPARFCVRAPNDWLAGAITPAVRRAWAVLPSGRLAVAVGDAWVTNDPLTGQGANLGSHSAWVAADHLAAGGPFDAAFGERLDRAMWEFAGPTTAWSNAFLQPPPPHVVELMFAAAAHGPVADRFVRLFDDPPAIWSVLSSPEATAAFVEDAQATVAA